MKEPIDKIAHYVSLVTSASVAAGVVYLWVSVIEGVLWFGVIGLMLGFLPPSVYVWFLLRRGVVGDWFVSDRRFRIGPLLASLGGFIVLFFLSLIYSLRVFNLLSFAYVCNTIVTIAVTMKWKISIHLYGLTGPLTFLVMVYDGFYWLWFLLVPIVAWARLRLRAHSLSQVIVGGVLGVFLTYLEIIVYNNLLFP